ncbi:polysaccharide biosynthesis tyrosine autokinase [Marinobacter sp. 1Y8]
MTELAPKLDIEVSEILTKAGQMGRVLVESGKIKSHDLERVIRFQKSRGLRFGEAAISLGLVTQEDVKAALAQQFSYSVAPLSNSQLSPSLTAAFYPQSRRMEALRGLRSELMLRYFDDPAQRVLPIVGVDREAASGELVANLAIVFSQLGANTLLIDGNLRQPSLHRLFALPDGPGLSDVLAGRAAPAPKLCAPLQSLWLLNGGTVAPNPQELLSHRRYRTLMTTLANNFDVVLVHTPPLKDNRDAQLISARAGAALMVAKENVTPLRALEAASRHLQEVGVSLMGVALSQ